MTSQYKIFPLASFRFSLVTDEQTSWIHYDAVGVSDVIVLNGRMNDELEKDVKRVVAA